jgi:hypothetical protein
VTSQLALTTQSRGPPYEHCIQVIIRRVGPLFWLLEAILIMPRRKKLPLIAPTTSQKLAVNGQSRTDLWLQRISHVSQFGLFLFTIGAIYYTVIPLYQKALLDEQIARKEMELANLQKTLNSSNGKIRSYAIGKYINYATAKCAHVLIPLPEPNSPKEPHYAQLVLNIDQKNCLQKALNDTASLKELNTNDFNYLVSEVLKIGEELKSSRSAAQIRFNRAEKTVKSNSSLAELSELGVSTRNVIQIIYKGRPEELWKAQVSAAIEQEKYNAAEAYSKDIELKLSSLRSIKWPLTTQSR